MVTCSLCGIEKATQALGICASCLKNYPAKTLNAISNAHNSSRYPLPDQPPRAAEGIPCRGCGNNCRPGPDEKGFCGLRINRNRRLIPLAGTAKSGLATWYHDPLPTNCVADWVCPGGSESGYPDYSYAPSAEYGYSNLAVFLGGCSFDCLFCQNRDHHRMATNLRPLTTPEELAQAVRPDTACICYFGGDPSPQVPFVLRASHLAREKKKGSILRICWETNGNFHPRYLKAIAELSLHSGGCLKFDLKAWNANLHLVLTGTTNHRTLENFASLAAYIRKRPDPPFLVASTLLIPGYVDAEEVSSIARFIAELDPNIPYSLLAFYPRHMMNDVPVTTWEQAKTCYEAARAQGLRQVRLGNIHLLA